MTEKEDALRLAHAVLDKPHIDPDGDISMLARQFLRAREEIDAMREALLEIEECSTLHDAGWPARHARAVLANFTVPGKQ